LPSTVLKDLDLFEEELAQGAIYIKQSKDLRITVEQVRKDFHVPDLLKGVFFLKRRMVLIILTKDFLSQAFYVIS